MVAPTNETEANTVFEDLKKANWTLLNTTGIGAVLENETIYEQNNILVNGGILIMCAFGRIQFDFFNYSYLMTILLL
jgi:hypothetical protein